MRGFRNPYRLLDQIIAGVTSILELLRRKPVKIALELPIITRKGKIMPNLELKNDTIETILIKTNDGGGVAVPPPAGDVFSVTSSSPSLGVAIGPDGASIVLTPLVQASPGIVVTVTDSAKLAPTTLTVDIVADLTPTNIVLDVADATTVSQPVPTAPGP